MSREIHDSKPQQKEQLHDVSENHSRLAQDGAAALTNPESKLKAGGSSADQSGIAKDFGNQKSFDFNTAPSPYNDKAAPQGHASDAKTQGQAHTVTDSKPVGETKPDYFNQPIKGLTDGKAKDSSSSSSEGKPGELASHEVAQKDNNKAPKGHIPDRASKAKPGDVTDPVVQPIPDPPADGASEKDKTPTGKIPNEISNDKPSDINEPVVKPIPDPPADGAQKDKTPGGQGPDEISNGRPSDVTDPVVEPIPDPPAQSGSDGDKAPAQAPESTKPSNQQKPLGVSGYDVMMQGISQLINPYGS